MLLDIRDRDSFVSGHIENALHLSSRNFKDTISSIDKDSTIIVYCYHGNSSKGVVQLLTEHGFLDVYSLDGGYEEWKIN